MRQWKKELSFATNKNRESRPRLKRRGGEIFANSKEKNYELRELRELLA